MRGYKLNADGRKTSYFNHDLDDEAKALIGDIAPKRLDPAAASDGGAAAGAVAGASAWNAAGTWEERNCSAWCAARLGELFAPGTPVPLGLEAAAAAACQGWALEVGGPLAEVEAEASVCVSRGKRRALLELSFTLPWRLTRRASLTGTGDEEAEEEEEEVRGTVAFADVSGDALEPEGGLAAAFLETCRVTVDDDDDDDDDDETDDAARARAQAEAQAAAVQGLVRAGGAGLQKWVAEQVRRLQAELAENQ
jgi:hypothetical protein